MTDLGNNSTSSPSSWISDSTTRSVYDILSICASTLVICVWSAVHPDIPTRKKSKFKLFAKQVEWMLVGIFIPDLLLYIALCQGISAIMLSRSIYSHLRDRIPLPRGWLYKRVILRGVLSPADTVRLPLRIVLRCSANEYMY